MHLDAQQKNKPIDIKCDIYSYLRFWMGKSETNKEIIWKGAQMEKKERRRQGP